MSKLKLGAQLYTVREYMKTEKDFGETIKKISDIGYKYVQVSGIGSVSPQAIKTITEDNGIKVILTHTSPERVKNETAKVIEEHSLFGCDAIGIGGLFGTSRSADGYKKFTDDFRNAVEEIKKSGKVFLYHNHRFEFERYDGKTGMDIILENTDKDAFKLTFDTYWAQAGGVDPSAFIKEKSDRIYVTHLKDMAVIDDKSVMTEVMTGNINFRRVLHVSEMFDIVWHFVEQDETRIDCFESMKISFDNLMATGIF